jgi:hypothetical protein
LFYIKNTLRSICGVFSAYAAHSVNFKFSFVVLMSDITTEGEVFC